MRSALTRTAIILIAANAGLAIAVLLGGEMSDTGGDILGTSLLATGTTLLVMILAPAMRDGRIGPAPWVAAGGAVVGFAIVTLGIWTSVEGDFGWKLAATAYTVAAAGVAASLLAGVSIEGAARWVEAATIGLVGLAAAMVIVAIWGEIGGDFYWRAFGVVGVLTAAGALAVPILGSSDNRASRAQLEQRVHHCPYCGARMAPQPASDATCPACGRRFTVSLRSGRDPGDDAASP